jgi:hypothetical protein
MAGADDFDFLIGDWRVSHRQRRQWLADCDEWLEFGGTTEVRKILGGQGNSDENWLDKPGGGYRATTVRTFDPAAGHWSIWWFDGRFPHRLEPPVLGRFEDGVGTFFADDEIDGRPTRVRFTWSGAETGAPHWEQAFSQDAGATWETNWIMQFRRA